MERQLPLTADNQVVQDGFCQYQMLESQVSLQWSGKQIE